MAIPATAPPCKPFASFSWLTGTGAVEFVVPVVAGADAVIPAISEFAVGADCADAELDVEVEVAIGVMGITSLLWRRVAT
jgi:uncharacterized membrane protein